MYCKFFVTENEKYCFRLKFQVIF